MKQYRFLLFDLDNTLLDFDAAEQVAIRKAFRDLSLEPTDALIDRYCAINIAQWEAFERGELTRDEVLVRRFALLFGELGLSLDPEHAEALYRGYLGIGHYFVPHAPELLAALASHYRLFIASNGVADTQESRLASAGIDTCWFNPKHSPGRPDIRPTYEIHSLPELPELLKKLASE